MKDYSGTTLGQYEIDEQIGRGGMATVYKAYHPRMRRHVAVKVLPQILAADPQFMARFEREAQTIAQLEHRSILPVHDYGEQNNTAYIVMRYIDTGTLSDRLQEGALSQEAIVRITRQLAEALDYAHQRGVIHRDLKPDNIFLDEENNAILGDFGIAQISEGTQELTGSAIIGTPAYMSPEQGQGLKLDGRSDIYALGVILFELFTGQVPFQSETPMGLVVMHITGTVPDVRALKPNLSPALAAVITKATARNRIHRYKTVTELADALEQAVFHPETFPLETPTTAAAEPATAELPPTPTPETAAVIPVSPPTTEAVPPPTPPKGFPRWAWAVVIIGVLAVIVIIGLALNGAEAQTAVVPTALSETATPLSPTQTPIAAAEPQTALLVIEAAPDTAWQQGDRSGPIQPDAPVPPPAPNEPLFLSSGSGILNLELPDTSQMLMDAQAQVAVLNLAGLHNDGGETQIEVIIGRVILISGDHPIVVLDSTGSQARTVKGTLGILMPDGAATLEVDCLAGACRLANKDGDEVLLVEGERSTLSADTGQPSSPQPAHTEEYSHLTTTDESESASPTPTATSSSATKESVEETPTTEPQDSDEDGIPDKEDDCPFEFGPVEEDGCPFVEEAPPPPEADPPEPPPDEEPEEPPPGEGPGEEPPDEDPAEPPPEEDPEAPPPGEQPEEPPEPGGP